MSLTGNRLAVGSPGYSQNGVTCGAVWMISDFGTSAQSEALLVPSFVASNLVFSHSLAIDASGEVVVVGAPRLGSGWPGRAFVFRFNGATWLEELQLVGANGDLFGLSTAVSATGEVLAVGAPGRDVNPAWNDDTGAVEVYRRHAGAWAYEALLRPVDWGGNDRFGNYMTISADGNVVAARSFNQNVTNSNGAIYIFEHVGGVWAQVAKLVEPISYSGGGFGTSLALDEAAQTLVVGNYSDNRIMYGQGAVTVFCKGSAGWAYSTTLLPSSPNINGGFGKSVSINAAGDRLLVGVPAQNFSTTEYVGAVEEFELSGAGWQSVGLHFAPSPEYNASFGTSISGSPSGRRWVASEPWSDYYGLDLGQIHIFDAPCLAPSVYCSAQANSLGCVPQLVAQGTPTSSASAGFTISLSNTRSQQNGLLFYGTNGRAALPWNGGTLCVQPPLRRTPLMNSGGSSPRVIDCSGVLALDFNSWAFTANDPELFPGQHVRAQFYARDPSATSLVYLSEALEFYLEP